MAICYSYGADNNYDVGIEAFNAYTHNHTTTTTTTTKCRGRCVLYTDSSRAAQVRKFGHVIRMDVFLCLYLCGIFCLGMWSTVISELQLFL